MAAFYSEKTRLLHSCGLIAAVLLLQLNVSIAQRVPALYVFGDSLVDVGNNDYIKTIFRANFPFNGVDYPGGKPTGRFSNGKNAADFIAEKVGLPTPPPYLSNKDDPFSQGVSFASGGAGILNSTNDSPFITIHLSNQVEYFSEVQQRLIKSIGSSAAPKQLSNSLFAVVIGSNDLFNYFRPKPKLPITKPPQEYIDLMLSTFWNQLTQLHGLGARKFLFVGIAPIGCTPSRRLMNTTEDDKCNDDANNWTTNYNQGLQSMLQRLKLQLENFNYTYLDIYGFLINLIQNPTIHGFVEVKAACCGLGRLNADVPCIPVSICCPNRSDHIFWDRVHPTEAVANSLINTLFNDTKQYVTSMSITKLLAL